MKKLVLLTLIVAACAVEAALRSVTPVPQNADAKSWWMSRHNQKMEFVKRGGAKIVFLGDSITHFWESNGREVWDKYFAQGRYKALNLGFSADRTEHALWRIAHGELDGYEAKAVVLMLGTNNAGHFPFEQEPPEDTIVGMKAVLDAIRTHQPKAKIILCAIFPRGANATDGARRRNNVVNKELVKFTNGKDILWCDFSQQYLTPEGVLPSEIFPDRLHPAACGYETWAAAVLPYLDFALDAREGDGRIFAPRGAAWVDPAQFAKDAPVTVIPATLFPAGGWWKDRPAQKRAEIVDGPKAYDVVFVGDSITHRLERAGGGGENVWADFTNAYTCLNLGYGGDRTQHVIWRLENGELEGYTANVFVLMIGTNNPDRPDAVAAGVKRILAIIRAKHPKAKIVLHPIFPRGATAQDGARRRNEAVNEIIKGYADGTTVRWLDFNAQFLDAAGNLRSGLMFPDNLHPAHAGYLIWRDALLPVLKETVGK